MFFFASISWHTRGALVTGVQTCARPWTWYAVAVHPVFAVACHVPATTEGAASSPLWRFSSRSVAGRPQWRLAIDPFQRRARYRARGQMRSGVAADPGDRKSGVVGKGVAVRGDSGGSRIF